MLFLGGIGVRVIDAIYQNGMFRPMSPLRLPEGTRVRIELEPPAAHARPSFPSRRDDHNLRQPANRDSEPTSHRPEQHGS
jgi:predicted DNA-binding antitoxin AbrB/MazE fold protein